MGVALIPNQLAMKDGIDSLIEIYCRLKVILSSMKNPDIGLMTSTRIVNPHHFNKYAF